VWEGIDDPNLLRHLELRQNAPRVFKQLGNIQLSALRDHDKCNWLLTHNQIRFGDNHSLEHSSMRRKDRLHLARRYVFTPADDEILLAVYENQIAILVEVTDVAGM